MKDLSKTYIHFSPIYLWAYGVLSIFFSFFFIEKRFCKIKTVGHLFNSVGKMSYRLSLFFALISYVGVWVGEREKFWGMQNRTSGIPHSTLRLMFTTIVSKPQSWTHCFFLMSAKEGMHLWHLTASRQSAHVPWQARQTFWGFLKFQWGSGWRRSCH